MARRKIIMPDKTFGRPHPGHEMHLCVLAAKKRIKKVAEIAKNPQFICCICGRVASDEKYLCEPKKIESVI